MTPSGVASIDFVGQRSALAKLVLQVGLLTLASLGFYRFWGRTRLRRWYLSAIRPGGHPLEYVGGGSEKLAGFLIAVCFLAFWLGVVNLILMFASLSVFAAPALAYVLSFAGLVPLWFLARYRARAYLLARTRWRGIRFYLAPGAGGYVIQVLWHGAITVLSLGVLWPRMTFKLEKYRTDRTYFGSARLNQGGSWQMLQPAFAHVLFGSGFALITLVLALTSTPRMALLLPVFCVWAAVGVVHYRVSSLVLMANNKTADGLGFVLAASPWTVMRIVAFGSLAMVIALLVPLGGLGVAVTLAPSELLESAVDPMAFGADGWAVLLLVVVLYFGLFLAWGVLRHALITLPLWRHYAQTLTVTGIDTLPQITQRDDEAADEAGGLAEALDIGAAI